MRAMAVFFLGGYFSPSLQLPRRRRPAGTAQVCRAPPMLVLSEIQKDAALRGKKARHKSAHPELEGGASTQNVQARLQRDSTRGRLAGALPGSAAV